MKPVIGMRILKTALAVSICVAISQLLKLEYPFYAAIAAIISMESSLTTSYKAGRNRMLGTLVGASIGLLLATIQPENIFLCGLGIILIITILNHFNWNSSISIAGIVFIAIMVNLDGQSPLQYSLNRLLDTAIGISVALAVNYLVFPHRIDAELTGQHSRLDERTRQMVQETLCAQRPCQPGELEKSISELTQHIHLHAADLKIRSAQHLELEALQSDLQRFKAICTHLTVLQELPSDGGLTPENAAHLQRLFPAAVCAPTTASAEPDPIYNYHARRILDLLA